MQTTQLKNNEARTDQKIDGVVIGLFLSMDKEGQPLVAYPGNPNEIAIPVRSTVSMQNQDIGCEVALMFEGGNPIRPLIIGKIQHVETEKEVKNSELANAELDGESIVLTAKQNITLKCGKASITLTKSGKILLRGEYLLSRSSGVNRIKGGSVQMN